MNTKNRIGFVSTRLGGTDGVSLETAKWSNVLTGLGHECFYFAGQSEWPEDRSYIVPEASFDHPLVRQLTAELFDGYVRPPETSHAVQTLKDHLYHHLQRFVRRFDLDMLIAENALSLPVNIPLGLALAQLIAETNLPTIAHDHDFTWERERFDVSAADDYLRAAFPPILHPIHHVVINSFARRQLALRTGASSTLIPNVMDFDHPPPAPDSYVAGLRTALDIRSTDHFLLQPTRIVPRKRIEFSIELARRLDLSCALVISHASGDEGDEYETYLREYTDIIGVPVHFVSGMFGPRRGQKADGSKVYSLADVYQAADLVTYPSAVEGFGNAFLEALYFRRPIVMSTYEIFKTDIQPKGFKVIGFADFITDACVRQARAILLDPKAAAEMVEHNYELGRRHYSYTSLERRLASLLSEHFGED